MSVTFRTSGWKWLPPSASIHSYIKASVHMLNLRQNRQNVLYQVKMADCRSTTGRIFVTSSSHSYVFNCLIEAVQCCSSESSNGSYERSSCACVSMGLTGGYVSTKSSNKELLVGLEGRCQLHQPRVIVHYSKWTDMLRRAILSNIFAFTYCEGTVR